MNVEDLTRQLKSPGLSTQWDEYLMEETGNRKIATEARRHIADTRDRCVAVLRDVDDPVDRRLAATHMYMRIRHEWIACNLQLQYQSSKGEPDSQLLYEAGLLTTLLEALEPVLTAQSLARLAPIFDDPLLLLDSPVATDTGNVTSVISDLAPAVADLHIQGGELRKQVQDLRSHLEAISREAGTSGISSVIAAIREQRDRAAAGARRTAELESERGILLRETATTGLDAVLALIREQDGRIRSLEGELAQFKVNREQLEHIAGSSEAAEIQALVKRYNDAISDLLERIAEAAVSEEELKLEFGTSAPTAIIQEARRLRDEFSALRKRLAELEEDRRTLRDATGFDEAGDLVRHVQSLKSSAVSYGDLAQLIGSMEQDLTELE